MSSIVFTADVLAELPDKDVENLAIPAQMTEEEFVDWTLQHEKLRIEWVNGEVIRMSPVSARHVRILLWLDRTLGMFVLYGNLGEVLGSDFTIRLTTQQGHSRRVPDLMFVRKDRLHLVLKNHLEGSPDLAIEIVSPDSKKRDWTDKVTEYEVAGIREYWIIDPLTNSFQALALDSHGKFISICNQPTGLFESQVVVGFRIQIDWFWCDDLPDPFSVLRGLGVIS